MSLSRSALKRLMGIPVIVTLLALLNRPSIVRRNRRGECAGQRAVEGRHQGEREKGRAEEEDSRATFEAGSDDRVQTDEGTWLSLDVSPDGKTILFDMLGDLYTVAIDGGDAKAITTRTGIRRSAELFARRQDDRVHQRP